MRVYRGIAGSAGQVFAISIGDMLACLRVTESFGEAEVDYVDVVLLFANSDQKVVRLDVSVEEVARVDKLDSLQLSKDVRARLDTYHLICKHENSL